MDPAELQSQNHKFVFSQKNKDCGTVEKSRPNSFTGTRVKTLTISTTLRSRTVQFCIATRKQLSTELFQKRCQEIWNGKAGTVPKREGQSKRSQRNY